MTYRGHVRDGQVILDERVPLPDGAEVTVDVAEAGEAAPDVDALSLYERMKSVVGTAKGLPQDASQNVDHYLYGAPKQ